MIGAGYRVWYDEGIDPGTEWDYNIASHITGCASFVAFISANYLASDNCKDELNYARDLQKERLLIYLEDVSLPMGMAMRLNRLQAIHQYTYADPEAFYEKLFSVPHFDACRDTEPAYAYAADKPISIKIIGVGGCGCNTVSRIIKTRAPGVEYIAVNTDSQGLSAAEADQKLLAAEGREIMKMGESLDALEQRMLGRYRQKITDMLSGADLVFVTCGLGGMAGSGLTPAIAAIAREMGILTVGVVSMPFRFERNRVEIARGAMEKLRQNADTLVVLHNDQLMSMGAGMTMSAAFALADETLCQGVQGIADLLTAPGIVALDFEDLRANLKDRGIGYIGVGLSNGPQRAAQAAAQAVANPMLVNGLGQARSVLVNITADDSLSLAEVDTVSQAVQSAASGSAQVALGTALDSGMQRSACVIVIATGE